MPEPANQPAKSSAPIPATAADHAAYEKVLSGLLFEKRGLELSDQGNKQAIGRMEQDSRLIAELLYGLLQRIGAAGKAVDASKLTRVDLSNHVVQLAEQLNTRIRAYLPGPEETKEKLRKQGDELEASRTLANDLQRQLDELKKRHSAPPTSPSHSGEGRILKLARSLEHLKNQDPRGIERVLSDRAQLDGPGQRSAALLLLDDPADVLSKLYAALSLEQSWRSGEQTKSRALLEAAPHLRDELTTWIAEAVSMGILVKELPSMSCELRQEIAIKLPSRSMTNLAALALVDERYHFALGLAGSANAIQDLPAGVRWMLAQLLPGQTQQIKLLFSNSRMQGVVQEFTNEQRTPNQGALDRALEKIEPLLKVFDVCDESRALRAWCKANPNEVRSALSVKTTAFLFFL